MNKLQEFLELNGMSEIYQKNRAQSSLPFPEEDIPDDNLLVCSFWWDETPEKYAFWESINNDYLDWLYEKQGRLENVR